MKRYCILAIILIVFVSGCGPKSKYQSRYSAMGKQRSYVSMKFEMDDKEYLGKTRQEMIDILGLPAQIFDKKAEGLDEETWIYYPDLSDNFVAIIISFKGETVQSASYESVI